MARVTQRRTIVQVSRDGTGAATSTVREDALAVEEPLEIRVDGESFAVTMRTPGHDFDLVAGFLVSEALASATEHVSAMRYCNGLDQDGRQTYNVIDVARGPGAPARDGAAVRKVLISSSCGICGTASIDAVRKTAQFDLAVDTSTIALSTLMSLPDALRTAQVVFERTGGVHAAGLFALDGTLLCLREDVGRHNAVDKIVGWALREGRLPLRETVLQVSGRASFELVQKAQLAGISILAAVSAPSSLAADLAESGGLTLVGFSRATGLNIYSHAHRVAL
jgi:FdhD protein